MSNARRIVFRVKAYNWTVVVEAASIEDAARKATRVLKAQLVSPRPTIESIERIGELEEAPGRTVEE